MTNGEGAVGRLKTALNLAGIEVDISGVIDYATQYTNTHTYTHTRTYVLNIPIEVNFICFNSILNRSFPHNSKSIISTTTFTLLSHFN
jgi:hypothetical protein